MPNFEDDEIDAIEAYDEATGAGDEPRDREVDEDMEDQRFMSGFVNDADAFDAKVKVFPVEAMADGRFNDWLGETDHDGDVIPRSVQTVEFYKDYVYVFYFQWI